MALPSSQGKSPNHLAYGCVRNAGDKLRFISTFLPHTSSTFLQMGIGKTYGCVVGFSKTIGYERDGVSVLPAPSSKVIVNSRMALPSSPLSRFPTSGFTTMMGLAIRIYHCEMKTSDQKSRAQCRMKGLPGSPRRTEVADVSCFHPP
jgi:hypothetical protein